MSAAVARALKKIAVHILSNAKARKGVLVAIGSIIAGFLGLMFLPIAVLSGMGESGVEDVDLGGLGLNGDMFLGQLTPEQQQNIDGFESAGNAVATAMSEAGYKSQTIKAQLIYLTYLSEIENFDFQSYANLFVAVDDAMLINSINRNYGTEISYDEFMKSYIWIMNTTINEYMFTDKSTKNNIDLSAWAENAYESGWAYKTGAYGEMDSEDKYRSCDNAGLVLGYLNYDSNERVFGSGFNTVSYTTKGSMDTMPNTVGIGLYDGTSLGVYVENNRVIYCTESDGMVIRQDLIEHQWTEWVTFDDVSYPDMDDSSSEED